MALSWETDRHNRSYGGPYRINRGVEGRGDEGNNLGDGCLRIDSDRELTHVVDHNLVDEWNAEEKTLPLDRVEFAETGNL